MKMKISCAVVLCACLLITHGDEQTLQTEGIHPEGSPLEIIEFKVIQPCHIESHCLGIVWRNTSQKTIMACEFRVFCFDALKRFSEYKTTHMFNRKAAPQESHQTPAFLEHRIGSFEANHICVVPERVLFDDESIWQRTDDSIYGTIIRKIKSDIDPECLKRTIDDLCSRLKS
jgi:hypothetical protein